MAHRTSPYTESGLDIAVLGKTKAPAKKPRSGRRGENTRVPFIAWDGEATTDAGYCLFGNSAGDELCKPNISGWELLEFLVDAGNRHKRAFHIGYGFDYDVDHILWNASKHRLALLAGTGKTTIDAPDGAKYQINYIPRKTFTVKKYTSELVEKDGRRQRVKKSLGSITIYDVVSYFVMRYDKALQKFKIGTAEEWEILEAGKEARDSFLWKDIEEIRRYFRLELALMPQLMDKIRMSVNMAGFPISQWYGPGAIAKEALKQHHMKNHMTRETPNEVLDRALLAYAGGWFERFQMGYYLGPVWLADINSAYPYAISRLPSLANGTWVHIESPDPKLVSRYRIGLWKIHYRIPPAMRFKVMYGHPIPFPLFQRKAGRIYHPPEVRNWYHSPEAALVATDPHATIEEAWVFVDDGSYPFDWVSEMYLRRLSYQQEGNPAQLAIKLGLNSLYGSMAQRIGWDEQKGTAPPWHQIEWAGAITSTARAMVYDAAKSVGNGLISIDTDGVISTKPFKYLPNGIGEGLGRWKVEKYTGILFLQNGMYWLRDESGEWLPPKTRGISRGRLVDREVGMEVLRNGGKLSDTARRYYGFRHALYGDWQARGSWLDVPVDFDMVYSGARAHNMWVCPACMGAPKSEWNKLDQNGLHVLTMQTIAYMQGARRGQKRSKLAQQKIDEWGGIESDPHQLPWRRNIKEDKAALLKRLHKHIDDETRIEKIESMRAAREWEEL